MVNERDEASAFGSKSETISCFTGRHLAAAASCRKHAPGVIRNRKQKTVRLRTSQLKLVIKQMNHSLILCPFR